MFLRTCLSFICPPRNRVENGGLLIVSSSGSGWVSSSVFSAPWPETKLPGDVRLVLAVPLSSSSLSLSPSVCPSLGISPSAPFSLLSDCLRSNRRNRKIYELRHAKLHKITLDFCFSFSFFLLFWLCTTAFQRSMTDRFKHIIILRLIIHTTSCEKWLNAFVLENISKVET